MSASVSSPDQLNRLSRAIPLEQSEAGFLVNNPFQNKLMLGTGSVSA